MKAPRGVKKSGRTIQLSRGEDVLTQMEAFRILSKITEKHVKLLSKEQPEGIRGRCEFRNNAYVGPGVCIAYKYVPEMFPAAKKGCKDCCSKEVVEQLNYIFEHAFDGKYKASWREKRKYNKRKVKQEIEM